MHGSLSVIARPTSVESEQPLRQPLWTSPARQTVIGRLRSDQSSVTDFVPLASWNLSDNGAGKYNALEEISPLVWRWTQSFAQIYDGQVYDIPPPVIPSSRISDLLEEDQEQLSRSWKQLLTELPPRRCPLLWQDVMLWALEHDIDKAMAFLDATISDRNITAPRYAVENALKCIVSAYSQRQVAEPTTWYKLHDLVRSFAAGSMIQDEHTSSMPQKIVYLLLQHSDDTRTQVLYQTLFGSRSHLHPYTLCRFMNNFSRMGRPDLAMDALRRIRASPHNVDYDVVRQSCMTLLRIRFGDTKWYRIQSQLATEMLELGIQPDIAMLNAMILNAVEASDYQTAYAIVETARLHGIRRDTITYSILLKGAFHNLDESLIAKIMQMAEEDGGLPRNNKLVSCLVATILKIHRHNGQAAVTRARGYIAMLRVYARYCDTRPLWELGIYVRSDEMLETAGQVSPPSPQLLSTMIMGYILLYGRHQDIQDLYHRYQYNVAQNHHLIAPTAATDHLANASCFVLGATEQLTGYLQLSFKICWSPPHR